MERNTAVRSQKKQNTDARILEAALKVFGEQGYSGASLTAIAAAAGVSQGLVSQRFFSKESLILSAYTSVPLGRIFESDEKLHMPDALCRLLDCMKEEVQTAPWRFAFLCMLHCNTDIPQSLRRYLKRSFETSPIREAMEEAQALGDLPQADVWDLYEVFIRTSSSIVGWYYRCGLPLPENETFLYAIQYRETEQAQKRRFAAGAGIASDFDMMYRVDAAADSYTQLYRRPNRPAESGLGERGEHYRETLAEAVGRLIVPEDRERFLKAAAPETVAEVLNRAPAYYIDFRLQHEIGILRYQAKFVKDNSRPDGSLFLLGLHSMETDALNF